MEDLEKLGPLAPLVGTWEGNDGLDVSFHHAEDEQKVADTGYFERVTFNAFGPVDNGNQHLYGLDYRMAAWRHGEEDDDPFHTEIGYWLWDADAGQVMRCFVVPRSTAAIAGGDATPDSRTLEMKAELGSQTYGVLENRYLSEAASTVRYEVKIEIAADGNSWSYDETTVLKMDFMDELLDHTDRNTLQRVE